MMILKQRWWRLMTLCVITGLLTLSSMFISPAIVWGQFPALNPSINSPSLPPGVERRGTLESAPIRLDGRELFRIASPTVLNRNDATLQIPVEVRAKQIELNLSRLVVNGTSGDVILNPQTMQVDIEVINGQPVLFVKDTSLVEANVLLTVTVADAQYHSTSPENLASQWQKILQDELRLALELRAPGALKQQIIATLQVILATALITLLLTGIWVILGRRKQSLEKRREESHTVLERRDRVQRDLPPTDPLTPDQEQFTFQILSHHFGLQQRLQTIQFIRWFLFWAIAMIWMSAIAHSLNNFPQTRFIAKQIVIIPIVLLITWFVTGIVNRLTDIATDRFIQSRELEQSLTPANLQRITTIARVIKSFKMVLLYTISLLWVLQSLNLASGAILTLGAVFALAVSFAAQNLVKDFVNGFLILLEDQFRIGDMVKIGTTTGLTTISGLVENLNLRLTQIRNDTGHLISIPNSTIAQVENMSRTWARADLRIEVAYDTDVNQALAIVRDTVEQLANDAEWQALILDTHEVFGVEQLSYTGVMIRLWIKTLPLKQWIVAREIRRRLKIAFDQAHIQIGMPQQMWLTKPDLDLPKLESQRSDRPSTD